MIVGKHRYMVTVMMTQVATRIAILPFTITGLKTLYREFRYLDLVKVHC